MSNLPQSTPFSVSAEERSNSTKQKQTKQTTQTKQTMKANTTTTKTPNRNSKPSAKIISADAYGRASRIIIHFANGRSPSPAADEDSAEHETIEMLSSMDGREKLLADIGFDLQVDIAEKITTCLLEMKALHNWKPSQGRERLDELAGKVLPPIDADFLKLVESRMVKEAVDLFTSDLLESPFETVWGNHLTILGQIEILSGDLTLAREGLYEHYEKAAAILIKRWGFTETIAFALPKKCAGFDSDWKVAMKVIRKNPAMKKWASL